MQSCGQVSGSLLSGIFGGINATDLIKEMVTSIGSNFGTVFIIYLLCFMFRAWEYFALRTDQSFWGEAFIHKLIGIAILCAVVKMISLTSGEIGFSKKHVVQNLLKGLLFGISIFAFAYGVEVVISVLQGNFQSLRLYVTTYAINGNIGHQTELIFFAICVVGNIINVIMEEGVFRGLFQQILQKKYSFLLSAVIASCLFGLWHIIAPIRNYYDGISSMGGFIAYAVMLVITSGLVGFKFAIMTKMTGSLYMAMGDHFVNNTIVNILHVVTHTGADELQFVRITIAQTLSFIVVLICCLKNQQR